VDYVDVHPDYLGKNEGTGIRHGFAERRLGPRHEFVVLQVLWPDMNDRVRAKKLSGLDPDLKPPEHLEFDSVNPWS
jgi:hypothetical protein